MNELVRRLKDGGDEAAVNLLVERYGPRLLSAATLLCGNAADAQDLMIETLQRAVRAIGGFRETSSLFSWHYGILFNLNRMAWRKRARSRVIYTDTLPEVAADQPDVARGWTRRRWRIVWRRRSGGFPRRIRRWWCCGITAS